MTKDQSTETIGLHLLDLPCLTDLSHTACLSTLEAEFVAEEMLSSSLDIDWLSESVSGRLDKLPERFFSRDFLSQIYSGLGEREVTLFFETSLTLLTDLLCVLLFCLEMSCSICSFSFSPPHNACYEVPGQVC